MFQYGNDPLTNILQSQSIFGTGSQLNYNPYNIDIGINRYMGPQMAQSLGPAAQLLQLAPMLLPGFRSGGIPSQWFPTQNTYDLMRSQRFTAGQRYLQMANSDRVARELSQYMAGMQQMTMGHVSSVDRQRFLHMSNTMAPMVNMLGPAVLPPAMLDLMPEVFGNRIIGQSLHNSLRNAYDPITGYRGYSGESAAAITSGIMSEFYTARPTSRLAMFRDLINTQATQPIDRDTIASFNPSVATRNDLATRLAAQEKISRDEARARIDAAASNLPEYSYTAAGNLLLEELAVTQAAQDPAVAIRRLRPQLDNTTRQRLTRELMRVAGVTEQDAVSAINSTYQKLQTTTAPTEVAQTTAGQVIIGDVMRQAYQRAEAMRQATPARYVTELGGLGVSESAALLADLSRRGLISPASRQELLQRIPGQLSDDELSRIARVVQQSDSTLSAAQARQVVTDTFETIQQGGPSLDNVLSTVAGQEFLRAADADRYKQVLTKYKDSVLAIKQIFGDAGRSDAPIPQLMEALNALTQGGLRSMDDKRLAQDVRTLYNLAKNADVGLEAMFGMTAEASDLARRYKLNPAMVPQLVAGSLAFSSAAVTSLGLDTNFYGAMDRDTLSKLDMQLRGSAAGSSRTRGFAALLRLRDEGGVALTGELAALAAAIEAGDVRTADGKSLLSYNQNKIMSLLAEQGVEVGTFQTLLQDQQGLQETASRYRMSDTVRRLQPEEFKKTAVAVLSTALLGSRSNEVPGAGTRVAESVANAIFSLDARNIVDSTKRATAIEAAIGQLSQADRQLLQAEFKETDIKKLANLVQLRTATQLQQITPEAYGVLNNLLQLLDPTTLQQTQQNIRTSEAESQIQSIMTGLPNENILKKLLNAVKSGNTDNLSTAVFGQSTDDIKRALDADGAGGGQLYDAMVAGVDDLHILAQKLGQAKTPAERQAAEKAFKDRADQLDAIIQGGGTATQRIKALQQAYTTATPDEQTKIMEDITLLQQATEAGTGLGDRLGRTGNALVDNSAVEADSQQMRIFELAKKYKLLDGTADISTFDIAKQTEMTHKLKGLAANPFLNIMTPTDRRLLLPAEATAGETAPAMPGSAAAAVQAPMAPAAGGNITGRLKITGGVRLENGTLQFVDTDAAADVQHTPPLNTAS